MMNIYDGILTLDDNWGDVKGNGEFAASGDQIQNLVRTELKARIGYFRCLPSKKDENANTLYGFMNEECYKLWEAEGYPEPSDLILSQDDISKGVPDPYYSVRLNHMHTSNEYISLEGFIKIPIKFTYTYTEFRAETGETSITNVTGQKGKVTIKARSSSNVDWDNVTDEYKKDIEILPSAYESSDPTTVVDLDDIITFDGKWEVLMYVEVETPNGKIVSTPYTLTVIKTDLSIRLTNNWEIPFVFTQNMINQRHPMELKFSCTGDYVKKYLNIEITGAGDYNRGGKLQILNYEIGSNKTFTCPINSKANDSYVIYNHGIHNITYWIEVDKDPEKSTVKKTVQVMVVSDENDYTPYIWFNDVKGSNINDPLINWTSYTEEPIFKYALYMPDPNNRGKLLQDVPIRLSFDNNLNQEQIFTTQVVNNNEINALEYDLSLELSSDVSGLFLYCESDKLNWSKKDGSSKQLMTVYISNTGDYAPSSGADFVFNPRIRSNDEPLDDDLFDSRLKIYNTADAKFIELPRDEVKWTGITFNNTDGWITDAVNGRCLRLLDKQQLVIPYQPFVGSTNNKTFTNTTIEVTFAVKNIVNDKIPLIRICDTKSKTDDGQTIYNGFELNASDAYYLPKVTKTKENLDAHDVVFAEDEKIHMVICINQEYSYEADFGKDRLKGTVPDIPNSQAYSINPNDFQVDKRFARIYINGILSRIVEIQTNDIYDGGELKRYIQLGNSTSENAADLDIYEIKVFHTDEPKKNYEILKDYIASLSSAAEKDKVISRNNILKSTENDQNIIRDGKISYEVCNSLYNTLLWKPGEKSTNNFARLCGREYGDTKKTSNTYNIGDLKINYISKDSNGNIKYGEDNKPIVDEERSGVIKNLTAEGQGTTAMFYFKWNQRWNFDEIDGQKPQFISSTGNTTNKGFYDMFPGDPIIKRLDGKVNWASSMQSHKMGATALYHDLWKKLINNSGLTALDNVGAFDALDLEKMKSKALTSEEAFEAANKFTGKNNGYGSCRVAVHQEPFLLFTQPTENTEPEFYGMMTFGAGKGDKPTFGYNKDFNKYFIMFEGTDNDRHLVSCNIPWDDYHFTQEFELEDGKLEVSDGIKYPVVTAEGVQHQEQFEVSMGDKSEEMVGAHWDGANPCLKMFKDMINFCYLHNPNLVRFPGSYDLLNSLTRDSNDVWKDGDGNEYDIDTNSFYWVITDSNSIPDMSEGSKSKRFDVYRWNQNNLDMNGEGTWVPAGLYNIDGEYYETLNLLDQLGYNSEDLITKPENELNDLFIGTRATYFKTGYKDYFKNHNSKHKYNYDENYPNGIYDFVHVDDLLFTLQFIKFVAGTDNWGKNTYIYNTGIYYKKNPDGSYMGGSAKYDGLDKFRFFQDDLDTIFEIDNYGSKTKPYYVEEHDYFINKSGKRDPYWNNDYNGMYKIAEIAFSQNGSSELKIMMRQLLESMGSLGGTPEGCLDKYFQGKCDTTFPEVIYNTTAEQFYLDGYFRGANRASERYNMFLSQCLGSQKSAETEWQKKRVAYMSSYASYGPFAAGTEGSGMSFAPQGVVSFELTPHIWLYPALTEGSGANMTLTSKFEESFNVPGRVPAGQKFTVTIRSNAGSENPLVIKGVDYYRDLGNLAKTSTPKNDPFNISGERLSNITVVGDNNNGIFFNPSGFNIAPAAKVNNIRSINISGNLANNMTSIMNMDSSDLSKLWRLDYLNLSATSIRNVTLPSDSNITTLILPKSTQSLVLKGQTRLSNLNLNNCYGSLKTIVITNPSDYIKEETLNILRNCKNAGAKLTKLELTNINWNLNADEIELLNYIINIQDLILTGRIKINGQLDPELKYFMLNKFGNVDNESNQLYIKYDYKNVEPYSAIIVGPSYVYKLGKYSYKLNPVGNTFIQYEWRLNDNYGADITLSNDGILTINNIDKYQGQTLTISCDMIYFLQLTPNQFNTVTITKTINLNERTPEIGDVVYADGTCSHPSDIDSNKTIIGKCFYINPDNPGDRRMIALHDISIAQNSDNYNHFGQESVNKFIFGLDTSVAEQQYCNLNPSDGYANIKIIEKIGDPTFSLPTNNNNTMRCYLSEIKDPNKDRFNNHGDEFALGDIGLYELDKPLLRKYVKSSADDMDYFNFEPEFPEKTEMPIGKYKTLAIVNHRNHNVIISMKKTQTTFPDGHSPSIPGISYNFADEVTLPDETIINPEAYETVNSIILNSGGSRASYYPAASLCYTYEPAVKNGEVLNDKFKRHNWYLPTFAEAARVWYLTQTKNDKKYSPFVEDSTGYKLTDIMWTSTICSTLGYAYNVDTKAKSYIFLSPSNSSYVGAATWLYTVRPVCSF